MLKINVGAGKIPLDGYTNIDRSTGGEAYPLSQDGVIFETGIADEIRASHVLEHFSHRDTLAVLKEWIRVLKPNGVLKIAVPDFDKACKLRDNDPLWDKYLMGGHIDGNDMHGAIFTQDKLVELMVEAGCRLPIITWNDNLDYCSNHPSGVSLNLQAEKSPLVNDVPKPIIQETIGSLLRKRPIIAVLSTPRIGFTCTHGLIETILTSFGIKCITYQGAYWEQGIQNTIERAIEDGYESVITLDFDSVFDQDQFSRMLTCWLGNPDIDALAPVQSQRGSGRPMMNILGITGNAGDKVVLEHQQNGVQCVTAHFGLTFIRTAKLKEMAKPWFWGQPAPLELPKEITDEYDKFVSHGQLAKFMKLFDKHFGIRFTSDKVEDSGCWKRGGSVDADIYFWGKWQAHGFNLRVLTDVVIGHLEVLVSQHNPNTGFAQYRSASDWNDDPYKGAFADVKKKEEVPEIPVEKKPLSPANAYTGEGAYFTELAEFPNDKYLQSFVQISKTCLGEPSTDLSGSVFQNAFIGKSKSCTKQKRIYITFSGARYHETTEKIVANAEKFRATEYCIYDDKWLIENHPRFIVARKDIFYDSKGSFTRGFGWFCWKPFIIQDALKRFCEPGDIVLFSDADCPPIADLTPFYDHADKNGCMLFAAAGLKQRHWCKRDTMRFMQMDCEKYREAQAGNARYMLFKKGADIGKTTVDIFMDRWLSLASNKLLTTFELSQDEYPELLPDPLTGQSIGQHRCEQAILTNLAHWYSIPLHKPPCQDGFR